MLRTSIRAVALLGLVGVSISCTPDKQGEVQAGPEAWSGQRRQATVALPPIVLQWDGHTGGCLDCDGGGYACLDKNDPRWARSFGDPVPSGHTVVGVEAKVYGASINNGNNTTGVAVRLNALALGNFTSVSRTCTQAGCDPVRSLARTNPAGIVEYAYGTPNTLRLVPDDNSYCVSRVDVHLTVAQRHVGASPAALGFPEQARDTTSATRTVTVSNDGEASVRINGLSIGSNQPFSAAFDGVAAPFDLPVGASRSISVTFTPTVVGTADGTLTIHSNATNDQVTVPLSGTGTSVVSVSPSALSFAPQKTGTSSPPQAVTLTNNGASEVSLDSITTSGQFVLVSNPAPYRLAPETTVTLEVVFQPTETGQEEGTLSITTDEPVPDGAPPATLTVALSGTGVASAANVSPTSLAFGDQRVGTTSSAKTVTVRNAGSSNLTVSSVSTTGPFAVSPNTGFVLAAGASKALSVTFTPSMKGAAMGSLSLITDDPTNPNPTVPLSGNGIQPELKVAPSSLVFDDQRVGTVSGHETVTIENVGDAPIVITTVYLSGEHSSSFTVSSTSGFMLMPNEKRDLSVAFGPTAEGVRTATLNVTTDYPPAPSASVALSGTGVKPTVSLSPPSIAFGEQRVGTISVGQQVIVKNSGSGTLEVGSVVASAGFAVTPSGAFELPAGASKELSVTFAPTSESAYTGTLEVSTNDLANPNATVTLSGTGVKPILSLSTNSLAFGERVVNTNTVLSVKVTNSGTGTLRIGAPSITTGAPFTVSPSNAFDVPGGASQDLLVTFTPTNPGMVTATLTLTSNDPASSSVTVALSGIGVKPTLSLDPTSITFGSQAVGTTSAPRKITVTNVAQGGTLSIKSISLDGPFVVTPSQPFNLGPGESQDLSVTFSPTAKGKVTSNLILTTNDPEKPSASVAVSGTGVAWIVMEPPDLLDFGPVRLGTNSSRDITLTNISSVPVYVQSRSAARPPFSISGASLPRTLDAFSSLTFSVTFSPTSKGPASLSFQVSSEASNSPHELTIRGEGVVAVAELTLPDRPGQTALDFGNVRVTTSKVEKVRLTNKGGAPLTLQQAYISSGAGSPFAYVGPTTLTLLPGTFIDFQVVFKPTESVIANDTLVIKSDAENSPTLLSLSGNGTYSEVKLDRQTIFFGDQRVGTESPAVPVVINNMGTAPLMVQSISVTGSFAVSHPDFTLPVEVPPASSRQFKVSFKPSVQGVQAGSISVFTDANRGGTGGPLPDGGTDDGGQVTLKLEGNGTIAAIELSQGALDFKQQRLSTTSGPQPVIISNTGNAELSITELIFSNPVFELASPLPPSEGSPLVIAAGQQKPVSVSFSPSTLGPVSGKLYIVSNAFKAPEPLGLMGEGVDGRISTTPSAVSFAGVEVGSPGEQKQVTLTNTGGYPLTIKSVIQPTEPSFAVSGLSPGLVLKPGDSWPFIVNFTPTRRGYLSGTLGIESDAVLNPSFNLSLSGTGVAAAVALVPTDINFGRTNVGIPTTQTISINNQGERPLYVSNIAFEDVPSSPEGGLDFNLAGTVEFPLEVAPAASAVVELKFTPRAVGSRLARAVVYTNDKAAVANLSGIGTSPTLKLSEPSLDFKNVLVGKPSAPRDLTITNIGNGPLTLDAVALAGADAAAFILTAPTLPLTLQPQASTKVSLSLKPDAERQFTAQLVVKSNDPNAPSASVTLAGVGVRQQIQLETSLEFGRQLVNHTSSARTVHVSNNSDAKITLTAISVEGEGASQFTVAKIPLPIVLEPTQMREVAVTFTPLAATEVNCELTLTFNDLPKPLTVALHGVGITSVLSVEPSPLDFGVVRVGGAKRELPLTITNLSSETVVLSEAEVRPETGEPFELDGKGLLGRLLEPGMPVIVTVGYAPRVETLSETTLAIGTTTPPKPRAVEVQLKGRAMRSLLSVDPGSLDFGWVDVVREGEAGPVAPKTVTVTNKSSQQQWVVVQLEDVEGTPFVLQTSALADPIPPGGTATFTVDFKPTGAGLVEKGIQVSLQGATSPEAVLSVRGSGRRLTGQSGGCSCGTTGAGSTALLTLFALVGVRLRQRRRD